MKKALCIVIVFVAVICICFFAFGNSNGGSSGLYAKVTYSDGSSETLDVEEIPDLISENVTAYNQKYAGQKIEVVDKVSSIGSGYGTGGYIMVTTRSRWSVCLDSDNPVIAELREGDTVKITGDLIRQSYTIQNETITKIG